ncbi:hypothetical protein [Streptosporangium roseum]|uniref:Uncharacterized protein n=1 Tax=Streptosporangium roseum (strain ATCC 12428 / DSM 43021 / JCM 3005 / KCTC 9067 / NCIMB 10171 / NRRL 2505 / NI 9100) TaxID=479432 RepID=D2B5U3_STRRD|nr:hypothetical protein [Streptosporangium roseum]ACZ91397.1 conserved hypothetical protein [Streptosporangium roseum DSM 43021]
MRLKLALVGGVVALALGAGLVGTAMADEPAPTKGDVSRPAVEPARSASPRPVPAGVREEPAPAVKKPGDPSVRLPRYTG